ncbi:MAG: hypothetical protein QOC69_6742 [Mycobacterium sp.]|nr:hypothetical protein [Mycobacterium sp.]
MSGYGASRDNGSDMDAFVSVYVDMAARADDVRVAVAELPKPHGVVEVKVDCDAITDTFGCRIAVDLTGTFDERTEGLAIARAYAADLSAALGVPAFAFYDLLRRDYPAS